MAQAQAAYIIDATTYPIAAAIQHTIRGQVTPDDLVNWITKYIPETDDNYRRVRTALLNAMKATSDILPTRGIVRASGNYKYVAISDNGAYINRISTVLDAIERSFSTLRGATIKSCAPGEYRVLGPPSPVGSHITLGVDSPLTVGEVVNFQLEHIEDYAHDSRGYTPSGFDNTFYPCRWFVVYVTGKGLQPYTKPYPDTPHISLGNLARRV